MTILNNLFFISVSRCGAHPVLENGVIVDVNSMFLKYKCNGFYTQVGPDTVVCHNDGTWSKLPECEGTDKSIPLFLIPKVYEKCYPNNDTFSLYFVQSHSVSWILLSMLGPIL